MEDFSFDVSGILTEEEAAKLFEEQETEEETPSDNEPEDNKPAEDEEEEPQNPESVGEEEPNEPDNAITPESAGSSPNVYSSIAKALKDDGIFPDSTDEDLEKVTTPEAFAELFDKAVSARMDERQRRIDEALSDGVAPDTIRSYEQTIEYLGGITDEAITAEGEEGDNLRGYLIYNDLLTRGYSKEKAQKEVEKSFRSGSDVEDAKDALEALTKYHKEAYAKERTAAKKQAEEARELERKNSEQFKKLILEDEVKIGDTVLDKRTRQRIYDAVSKPVYKDEKSGRLLTALQQFQKEKPLEFLKQLGMWFVLTDGGKNTEGFVKQQVQTAKNKGIRELARKINTTSLASDGSLQYARTSAEEGEKDILLSDDWKVGFGRN